MTGEQAAWMIVIIFQGVIVGLFLDGIHAVRRDIKQFREAMEHYEKFRQIREQTKE